MDFNTLKKIVLGKQKGSFSSMVWEKELPLKKAFKGNNIVTKRSYGVVRCGIVYDNINSVQEKRATGVLPAVNNGLVWGEWLIPNYFIKHNGKIYLRCAESKANKIKTVYFLNGRPVEKSAVEPMCLASAFSKHDSLDVFTINIENIISIR